MSLDPRNRENYWKFRFLFLNQMLILSIVLYVAGCTCLDFAGSLIIKIKLFFWLIRLVVIKALMQDILVWFTVLYYLLIT